MAFSIYDASVPPMIRTLENLSKILDKAVAQAKSEDKDLKTLLEARLAPDMHPLTRQIQIRPEHLLTAASSGFKRSGGENFSYEIRIPSARQCDWLRETCAPPGHLTVQDLIVKDCRNPQSRLFNQPLLQRVCKDGSVPRPLLLTLSGDLADAVSGIAQDEVERACRHRLLARCQVSLHQLRALGEGRFHALKCRVRVG